MKTLIQCDFDGTITEEDMGYLLLRTFAGENWKRLRDEYRAGKMSVGLFNTQAFATVKADKQTLIDFVKSRARIRLGFRELLDYCREQGFRFVIVSNGSVFYIEAILEDNDVDDVEILAAEADFTPDGIDSRYIGPEGKQIEDGFKETYIHKFLKEGYRVVYIGNGASDVSPAKQAHYIFAIDDMLTRCEDEKLKCIPFNDLKDVIRGLELLP